MKPEKSIEKPEDQWPPITVEKNRFRVNLRSVDKGRPYFPTREAAETFAEQCRIDRDNEGKAAFDLTIAEKVDAAKANKILAPHGVSLLDAARHYEETVLAYKSAPVVKEIVARYIADAKASNAKPRYIEDLNSRLKNMFVEDFGSEKLSDIQLDELKEWVNDDNWEPRTRSSYLTRIAQLYNYAKLHGWVGANLTERIQRPKMDETQPEIFSVDEAERLLTEASQFELLPYVAIGLFAGVRRSELVLLKGENVNFEQEIITIPASIAKLRSQRHVDMKPALLAWLETCKDDFKRGEPIVTTRNIRNGKPQLIKAANIENWPDNALRHSFGSYHYMNFQDLNNTAYQMGNSSEVVLKHYRALVTKADAEKFWSLRPKSNSPE